MMLPQAASELTTLWYKTPKKRTEIKQAWPELAEAIENIGLSAALPLPDIKIDVEAGPPQKQESCDGCRTIERMRTQVKPNDEEAFYQFRRAERMHRRECPNR